MKKTGWKWRDSELSLKEFQKLSKLDKEEYIDLIKGLKPEQRSSGDIIIFNLYASKEENTNIKFFSL